MCMGTTSLRFFPTSSVLVTQQLCWIVALDGVFLADCFCGVFTDWFYREKFDCGKLALI